MPFSACRFCLCFLLLMSVGGCHRAASSTSKGKKESPAKVTGAVNEDQLTTIELTEDAEKRLGIETATIEIKTRPLFRSFGGEVTIPTGATIIVTAPVTGKLQLPSKEPLSLPGSMLTEKQPVVALIPVLTPSEKIGLATQLADAEGLVEQAQSQVDANLIEVKRAEQQLSKGVGLAKALDDAKAKLTLSEKALEAAISRKKVLNAARLDGDSIADQKPILIESPQTGILRAIHVLPDEFVTASAPLFEVMKTEMIWVRVPIYVGENSEIATDRPALVSDLGSRAGQVSIQAEPVAAPPTATALASTMDLYYQMPNSDGKLRPGQRVSVQLPLVGQSDQRVVPWSAVVQDINGGYWVYEKIGDHKYARRRVEVKRVVDGDAILERGPKVGTIVISTGVAEVFGAEFGVGK